MSAMSVFMFVFMLGGSLLPQIAEAPPRDLVSLLNAPAVLEQAGVKTDEASLIALLAVKAAVTPPGEQDLKKAVQDLSAEKFETRRQAQEILAGAGERARAFLTEGMQSPDPEVKMTCRELLAAITQPKEAAASKQGETYLHRLLAIRLLERKKSTAALPALQAAANDNDITLAAAAQEAIAVIKGEKNPRPSGADALKAMEKHLPRDLGFIGLLNLERGSKDRSVRDHYNALRTTPALAPLFLMMGADADRFSAEMEKHITEIIASVGNIRIDAIAMIGSSNIDLVNDRGYIAWVFKGLHNPTRLAASLQADFGDEERAAIGPYAVFAGHDIACVSLDASTLIVSIGGGGRDQRIADMGQIMEALTRQKEESPAAHIAPAFAAIARDDTRIALSGVLTDDQKRIIREAMDQEMAQAQNHPDGQDKQLQVAAIEIFRGLGNVNLLTGRLSTKAIVTLEGDCAEQKDTEALSQSLAQLRKAAAAKLAGEAVNAPQGLNIDATKMWEESVKDKKVTVTTAPSTLQTFSAFFTRSMSPVVPPAEVTTQPLPPEIENQEDE